MTPDEIARLVGIAVGLGMKKVKLTGGEPLIREDIVEIVHKIARIKGIKDLSMTTNGTFLEKYAEALHNAGLVRVNVSIPTLKADVYNKLTGGNLHNVMKGVKKLSRLVFIQLNLTCLF
jgi:cyclic pyranopterin phosphate synthase